MSFYANIKKKKRFKRSNEKMKKLLSVFLAAVMLVCCFFCVPASAKYVKENHLRTVYPELSSLSGEGEIYPTIILPGINHSPYYLADENGNAVTDEEGNVLSSTLLLLNQSSLLKNVLLLVPRLLASLVFQKDAGVTTAVGNLVRDLMKYMEETPDGNNIYNLITRKFDVPVSEMSEDDRDFFYTMLPVEPIAEICGEENLFLYTFNLFGDPMESVKNLDSFIDSVLQKTGAKKVNLASVSLGGTMLTAYAETGKNLSKVAKIVNMVSLLGGTDIMADFIDRSFNVSDEFFRKEYFPLVLESLTGDKGLGNLINIALHILPRSVFEGIISAAYGALHDTVIVNNPEFWAMVPADRYESLAQKWIKSDVLRAKTDAFQTARVNLFKNLKKMSENGTEVYSICGYNLSYTDGDYAFFGIVKSSENANGDGIIPVSSTSLGATAVKAKTEFDSQYLSNHSSKYISPDKCVDASTCLFPERTWFFSGQHHEVGRNDVVIRLAASIIKGAVKDIGSTELFPQFNGARNSRAMTRVPNGRIFRAIDALEGNELSAEQKEVLRPAYENALSVIQSTKCDIKKTEEANAKLTEAFRKVGMEEKGKKEFKLSGVSLVEKLDDYLYNRFGGNGFIGR